MMKKQIITLAGARTLYFGTDYKYYTLVTKKFCKTHVKVSDELYCDFRTINVYVKDDEDNYFYFCVVVNSKKLHPFSDSDFLANIHVVNKDYPIVDWYGDDHGVDSDDAPVELFPCPKENVDIYPYVDDSEQKD